LLEDSASDPDYDSDEDITLPNKKEKEIYEDDEGMS
jgi:hypothetical protein